MNEPTATPNSKPHKTRFSSFLLVLTAFTVVCAVFVFFTGQSGLVIGFRCLLAALGFFALRQALDYLHESVEVLKRIEDRLNGKKE